MEYIYFKRKKSSLYPHASRREFYAVSDKSSTLATVLISYELGSFIGRNAATKAKRAEVVNCVSRQFQVLLRKGLYGLKPSETRHFAYECEVLSGTILY